MKDKKHQALLAAEATFRRYGHHHEAKGASDKAAENFALADQMLQALQGLSSPVVLVSNEVGWGISPMSASVRAFVDELGWLNQAVARRCQQVTLMVAGQAWTRPVDTVQVDLP